VASRVTLRDSRSADDVAIGHARILDSQIN
jgi:hypothetical protein